MPVVVLVSLYFLWSVIFIGDTRNKLTDEELRIAFDDGIIDLALIREQIEMSKRKILLEKHPYKIWQGNDGKWYVKLPDEKKGRIQRKRNTKKEIEDLVIQYQRDREENPTIKEVFIEWNDRRLAMGQISSSTHMRNQYVFDRHYKDFCNKKIGSVSEDEFADFLEEQIPKFNLTAKAFSNLKTVTRGFLKRAKKRKLIQFNVENFLNELDVSDQRFKRRMKKDSDEVFTEDEFPVLVQYLMDNLDIQNLGILLMLVTGIRVGELVTLKYEDFQNDATFEIKRTETTWKDENKKYHHTVKEAPKTEAGFREVIIPKEYRWIYKEFRKRNPFGEYIMMKNGERMHCGAIRQRQYRVCDKLHIKHKSPHKCRKTYASILLGSGIDEEVVISQMGHTDIQTTKGFYQKDRKNVETKKEILSNIPEFIIR